MNQATAKKSKPSTYQVLLLDNGEQDDVEVREAAQVDFCAVKQHLKNGGSVFITSRAEQKIQPPKTNAQNNYVTARRNMGFLFRRHLR